MPRITGIHSLPIELLTIVFLLGAQFDDPYADGPFLLKPEQEYKPVPSSNFQVLVSHVCRHWRQVALATPTLWTTLHFRDPSHLSRAKTYLARCSSSQTYLLDVLVETVAIEDHVPGKTLYNEELDQIFHIIIPHIKRWRAFHLKISDNDCKGTARLHLSTCGGAPNLETLQLYHFENYRTSQSLYLATYRPPVIIFGNSLPRLRNISLIGVNLAWENSPYLTRLHQLELALHRESVRPLYRWWDHFLRSSPDLKVLCLHYSGPRDASPGDPAREWFDPQRQIELHKLRELSLTDLDPESLCEMVRRLRLPGLRKLSLDLPEQDYTPFMELVAAPPSPALTSSSNGSGNTSPTDISTVTQASPILSLATVETLIIHSLECSPESWAGFLRAAQNVRKLKVNFGRVGVDFWDVFTQNEARDRDEDGPSSLLLLGAAESQQSALQVQTTEQTPETRGTCHSTAATTSILLPRLETFELTGVSGEQIIAALRHRHRQRRRYRGTSQPHIAPRKQEWVVGWSRRRREADPLLDQLIIRGYWVPMCEESWREEDRVAVSGVYDDEDEEDDDEEEEEEEAADEDEEDEE